MEALGVTPIGATDEAPAARVDPGNGWLLCDGRVISRATYATLFSVIAPVLGAPTVTAGSAIFTLTAHGLVIGDQVYFTGTMPTGLAANTLYWVRTVPTANTFTVTATAPTAVPATWVAGSSDVVPGGAGSPTLVSCPFGLGDGSTTFNLPDSRGRIPFAPDNMGTAQGAAGRRPNSHSALGRFESGSELVTLAAAESGMVGHNHGGATGGGVTGTGVTGTASGNTNAEPEAHTHGLSVSVNGVGGDHQHPASYSGANYSAGNANNFNQPDGSARSGAVATGGSSGGHSHGGCSGHLNGEGQAHSHNFTIPSLTMPALSIPALSIATEARAAAAPHNNVPPALAASLVIRAL